MSQFQLHQSASPKQASQALADWAAGHLQAAIAARGRASIAVPGGSTPVAFLEQLSPASLDWACVTVLLTDERLVAPGDSRSNEAMLRAHLGPLAQGLCRFISFHREGLSAEAAALAVDRDISAVAPLDVCISGMGADMHVASLFPHDTSWVELSARLVIATHPPGLEPRLSLSPAALQSARHMALLINGDVKLAAFKAALTISETAEAPVRLLLREGRTLHVFAAM